MAKFSPDRFPAGFFDLSQDIASGFPVEVIARWTRGRQDVETALELLDPFRVQCTVVSTDSAGLTNLTRSRGLIEILSLINRPKELVHAWGTAAGGASNGVWAADNTQMFFPLTVPPTRIASMLLSLMDQIAASCELRIGAAVHYGSFFLLSGGFHGTEADRVECIAEDWTRAGEVLLTPEFTRMLPDEHSFSLAPRLGLPAELGPALRLLDGPRAEDLVPVDYRYPLPYSQGFYEDLKRCAENFATEAVMDEMRSKYSQRRAVVLIEREREESEVAEIAVLNELALSAAMKRMGVELLRDTGGQEIKTAGPLGIYSFHGASEALGFARRFRQAFLDQGIESRIGIDEGEVLVFDIGGGLVDIAGGPVNLASKLAQDHGAFGRIYLTAEAASGCGDGGQFTPMRIEISGVRVDAVSA
ncbi:MAG: family 3 adenylate cyclase [Acidobacteriia bacterium]|nr:family 3 adenylate cyclase [Terriglobia bacterium]